QTPFLPSSAEIGPSGVPRTKNARVSGTSCSRPSSGNRLHGNDLVMQDDSAEPPNRRQSVRLKKANQIVIVELARLFCCAGVRLRCSKSCENERYEGRHGRTGGRRVR